MKRSIFVATLALTPALLHAQVASPAQTANTIQARLTAPAAIKAAADKNSADKNSPSTLRVSTGIVAPKLLNKADLVSVAGMHDRLLANDATVVVNLVVDATGKPSDLSIAQGSNPIIDKEVLESVAKYRFQPGTLDGQPYALPVRLQVNIQHGVQY
jgi:TonB family protein